MKTKNIDCIAMKRRSALAIHRRLAGKSLDQQVRYWRDRNIAFLREQTASRSQTNRRLAPP